MACCCLVAKLCPTLLRPHGLSVGFSRQENWSGLPFPSPGDLPDPGIKPVAPAASPALWADSLSLSHYFVLLDCFPFLLHFFFTYLMKFILRLKFFYNKRQAEDMGQSLFWDGLLGWCSVTCLLNSFPYTFWTPSRDHDQCSQVSEKYWGSDSAWFCQTLSACYPEINLRHKKTTV